MSNVQSQNEESRIVSIQKTLLDSANKTILRLVDSNEELEYLYNR